MMALRRFLQQKMRRYIWSNQSHLSMRGAKPETLP